MALQSIVQKMLKGLAFVSMALFALIILTGIGAKIMIPGQKTFMQNGLPEDVMALDQNWTQDIRQQVNFTSFGSRLLPYDIFINLEHPDQPLLLKDPQVTEALGFITQRPSENNPDALPVGFARDKDEYGQTWVGLTCAACHMGQLTYQGRKMFIDGGAGMLNFTEFEVTVRDALRAALNRPEKYERLIARLREQGSSTDNVKQMLVDRLEFLDHRLQVNKVEVPYGYGRLDAFGQIFNAVTATALGLPDNGHSPNAPVSIPVLWDASHLDLVQWNASAPNKNPGPLGQNVTTALAVYGQIDMRNGGWGYKSSVDIANLGYIQQQFYKLTSPQWPEGVLGTIDQSKAAQGKGIYQNQCIDCHALVDRDDPKRKLRAAVIPLDEVKTDPQMARNFVSLQAKTGLLEGKKQAVLFGKPFGEQARTFFIAVNAAVGAMIRRPVATLSAFLAETESVLDTPVNFNREVYKGRPLNGIWSAGPYLHNGSVPTVYDLLQPQEERPVTFYVGSRELDPVKIGLVSQQVPNSSEFDTRLQGNSNRGHEYGTDLTEKQKWALLEYLKTL